MMNEAEDFLRRAGVSFHLAEHCLNARAAAHYSEMGRDYVRQSHEAAQIVVPAANRPAWWHFAH